MNQDTPASLFQQDYIASHLITPVSWVNTHSWLIITTGEAATGDSTKTTTYYQRPYKLY